MKNKVIGYRHTGIIVHDMEKSLKFYKEHLGLEIIQEFTDDSSYINEITNIKNGCAHFIKLKMLDGSVLELLEYPTHRTEPHKLSILNVGIAHIALRVYSADEMYKYLVDNGIKVLSKPVLSSEGIAKVFFCIDPNGLRVELVEMI